MSLNVISQINPAAKWLVVWLHGLGADGNDFVPVAQMMATQIPFQASYIFPEAPVQPVTVNGGMSMRAWYDIKAIDIDREIDEEGIQDSAKQLQQVLEDTWQSQGIKPENTIIAGFSQGAVMALHLLRHSDHRFAAVIALSGYYAGDFDGLKTADDTPVFMGHGIQDPVVPHALGKSAFDTLEAAGINVQWHEYNMQHSVLPEEINDFNTWLAEIVKSSTI